MPEAIIADDEPMMRAALRDQLSALWPELEIRAEAEDGPSALQKVEIHRPDVAFLDIRMPGMTGLEVARALTVPTRVVFVTAFDAHAVEAFEANAIDYVLKPLETPRLARCVSKLRQSLATGEPSMAQLLSALARSGLPLIAQRSVADASSEDERAQHTHGSLEWLQVAVGRAIHMVHLEDVIYFASDTKYTRVVAEDFEGLIRVPLKELLQSCDTQLPGRYVQTHRGTVVNRRFIRAVHRFDELVELELKGRKERLRVSVANHHLFRAM